MEENWQDVITKRKSKQHVQKDGPRITFFVSNLPDGVTDMDVGKVFSQYGTVVDVYVARKRDKLGNVFAFVRFANVADIQILENSLKGIKMGYSKLFVSLAKFGKGGKKVFQVVGDRPKSKGKSIWRPVDIPTEHAKSSGGDDAASFKEVLTGGSSGLSNVPELIIYNQESVIAGLLANCSLLGRVSDIKYLCNMHNLVKLFDDGPALRYVGGMSVLLSFKSTQSALEFLNENKEVWKEWFTVLEPWNGQVIKFERIAWLKVYGVPVQIWDNVTFDQIGRRYGKVVQRSKASWNDSDLSYECIGVLVNDGNKIKEEIMLSWREMKFRCWVYEEERNWVPGFVSKDDSKMSNTTLDLEKQSGSGCASMEQCPARSPEIVGIWVDVVPECNNGEGKSRSNSNSNSPVNLDNRVTVDAGVVTVTDTEPSQLGNILEESGVHILKESGVAERSDLQVLHGPTIQTLQANIPQSLKTLVRANEDVLEDVLPMDKNKEHPITKGIPYQATKKKNGGPDEEINGQGPSYNNMGQSYQDGPGCYNGPSSHASYKVNGPGNDLQTRPNSNCPDPNPSNVTKQIFYFNAQANTTGGPNFIKGARKHKILSVGDVVKTGEDKSKKRDVNTGEEDLFNLDKIIASALKKTPKRRSKECSGFDLFGNYAKTPVKRFQCNVSPLDLQLRIGGYETSIRDSGVSGKIS